MWNRKFQNMRKVLRIFIENIEKHERNFSHQIEKKDDMLKKKLF